MNERIRAIRDILAKDYGTAPLGFSGRETFNEKETMDFKSGFTAAHDLVMKHAQGLVEALERYKHLSMPDSFGPERKMIPYAEQALETWKKETGE